MKNLLFVLLMVIFSGCYTQLYLSDEPSVSSDPNQHNIYANDTAPWNSEYYYAYYHGPYWRLVFGNTYPWYINYPCSYPYYVWRPYWNHNHFGNHWRYFPRNSYSYPKKEPIRREGTTRRQSSNREHSPVRMQTPNRIIVPQMQTPTYTRQSNTQRSNTQHYIAPSTQRNSSNSRSSGAQRHR